MHAQVRGSDSDSSDASDDGSDSEPPAPPRSKARTPRGRAKPLADRTRQEGEAEATTGGHTDPVKGVVQAVAGLNAALKAAKPKGGGWVPEALVVLRDAIADHVSVMGG